MNILGTDIICPFHELFRFKERPRKWLKDCRDYLTSGADPGFFLGGGALVSSNKPHSFFFCRLPVVLENRRSSQGGKVRTPCTLPLDPPLHVVRFWEVLVSCRWILTVMLKLRAKGLTMSMQQSLKRMVKLNIWGSHSYFQCIQLVRKWDYYLHFC